MSIVTVQLGQCGNQIGNQLFSTIYNDAQVHQRLHRDYDSSSIERFFYASPNTACAPMPRAVLVDMESKVIQQTISSARRSKTWLYDERCVYTQKRGSGNNWANGYLCHGPSACDDILEMVQRQTERCDSLAGFLVLMSVAGGTGSGVGARVSEEIKDSYPKSVLANQIVWPYDSGEVIVQDYNTLLTTAHLQRVSDAILLLQNDQLHKVCSKLLRLKEITFKDINSVVCHSLASVLQPSIRFDHHNQISSSAPDSLLYNMCSLTALQESLCPTPSYKMLSLKTIPQIPERSHEYTHYLWSGLLKHLRQMLITNSPIEEGMDWARDIGVQRPSRPTNPEQYASLCSPDHFNTSLANLIVLRGNELNAVDTSGFTDPRLYSNSVPQSCTCSVWCSSLGFNGYEKTCTLVSNSQSCIRPLNSVCRKAWNMYTAKAYVHQYEKYGLDSEDFLSCFVTMEQLIKDYAGLQL
ncbi:tubulin delta chain-like [Halichondria panicea]|uniref:tubulin delta chain-like n=1 Tax=Halichondria panicea TaxID=6063 RepID=UPI00312BC8FD